MSTAWGSWVVQSPVKERKGHLIAAYSYLKGSCRRQQIWALQRSKSSWLGGSGRKNIRKILSTRNVQKWRRFSNGGWKILEHFETETKPWLMWSGFGDTELFWVGGWTAQPQEDSSNEHFYGSVKWNRPYFHLPVHNLGQCLLLYSCLDLIFQGTTSTKLTAHPVFLLIFLFYFSCLLLLWRQTFYSSCCNKEILISLPEVSCNVFLGIFTKSLLVSCKLKKM